MGGEAIPGHLKNCSVFLENIVTVDEIVKFARQEFKARIVRKGRSMDNVEE
jgi:uncharacterized protein YerC